MSHDEVPLDEFAHAFAQMLPGSGDVLLYSSSTEDTRVLGLHGNFVLQLVAEDADEQQLLTSSSMVIARTFPLADPPLSPELFAGVWVRLDTSVTASAVQNCLRLLRPGGLMVLIGASASHLNSLAAAAMTTSARALRTVPLKD